MFTIRKIIITIALTGGIFLLNELINLAKLIG